MECGEGSSPKPSPWGNFATTVSKDGRRPSSGTGFCAEWEPWGRRQLLSPHGHLAGAWGLSRAGGTESGFARLGWCILMPLAGRGAGQERGSPLLVARAGPPGPGLFRRGVTEAGKRKRWRQPSAARDGGRGLRVAFKVSRNPSAAGGGWRSARGFLGLWLLRFSHRCRFLTLGFNFVVAAGGILRGGAQGWPRAHASL